MLVLGLNTGHDGAFAAIEDGKLLFSQEAEKDSAKRYSSVSATGFLNAVEHLGAVPDVVAYSGEWNGSETGIIGAGYMGASLEHVQQRPMNFLGRQVMLVSTTHERAHIMGALAMAPRDAAPVHAALVWEGLLGKLYLVDDRGVVFREVDIQNMPGTRWAFLFALANPDFPDGEVPLDSDAGKLMALAAYGDPADADQAVSDTIERILAAEMRDMWPAAKHKFADSPVHNAGVEADVTKAAAALLSARLFGMFSDAAVKNLPHRVPLYISGGCGLNCDWNRMWRDLGHFSSVFVPPCANDSGQAIGAAAEAWLLYTGESSIEWDVYSGLEFERDVEPDSSDWERRPAEPRAIAGALAQGRIFAWARGRAEIGPRALGNRSLLADATHPRTRDRLNEIKQREHYRPIAPVCRVEDLGEAFDADFEDPYMLYFRNVTSDRLGAVTHVDGSARCQTVRHDQNPPLHDLLSAVASHNGPGVLCNTSLNWHGCGFINKTSELVKYCDARGLHDFVVEDAWYQRVTH